MGHAEQVVQHAAHLRAVDLVEFVSSDRTLLAALEERRRFEVRKPSRARSRTRRLGAHETVTGGGIGVGDAPANDEPDHAALVDEFDLRPGRELIALPDLERDHDLPFFPRE